MVLVVDDDADVRRLFGHALARAGFRARECRSGREALAALHEDEVALVLLDSRMPEMDGVAVLRAMRADASTRAIPVVMVTGQGEVDERVAGLVHFGEATGSMLIAEGVERAAEDDALRGLRVPLAQGYLYGRPAPVAA